MFDDFFVQWNTPTARSFQRACVLCMLWHGVSAKVVALHGHVCSDGKMISLVGRTSNVRLK